MTPKINHTNDKLTVSFDTTGIPLPQQRLIKSLAATLVNVMGTDNEGEFFEGSAELLRLVASVIQQAKFCSQKTDIPYASQAVEYGVDVLQEHLSNSKVLKYDN